MGIRKRGPGPFHGVVNWENAFGVSDAVNPFLLLTFVLIKQQQEGFSPDQTSKYGLLGHRQSLAPDNN